MSFIYKIEKVLRAFLIAQSPKKSNFKKGIIIKGRFTHLSIGFLFIRSSTLHYSNQI